MKRINQELASEVQSLRENSESEERLHVEAIDQLAQEIAEQKVATQWGKLLDRHSLQVT